MLAINASMSEQHICALNGVHSWDGTKKKNSMANGQTPATNDNRRHIII